MPILSNTLGCLLAQATPTLSWLDWTIISVCLMTVLVIGALVARQSGKDASQFFLSGRGMPWWLLGASMVATTFAADTPNLVTDLVRTRGVSGNWLWWAFLLTGMLTVFNFAGLWRRSGLMTDLGFYEMRYGGRPAAFLRAFRALYLGVVFNVIVMAIVMLAAIKMGQVLFGVGPLVSISVASIATIFFSALGGFRAVVLTDGILFILAMAGSITAAWFAVNRPEVGGLANLVSQESLADKLRLIPPVDWGSPESINNLLTVLIIPLAVQWWSVWYPGSEPGGGGYLAQRMLAARDAGHATAAALFFNCAHYALRPWPWILVALASLMVYPDLDSIRSAFPGVDDSKIGHDLAYPAMLTQLPSGWLGLVLASLLAAYMSTISTHLNWGASYVVNDFYKRFLRPDASQARQVVVGRVSTVFMMLAAAVMALQLQHATQGFQIVLQVGAGTGLLFILRWYWWRINAYSEIAAMIISFVVAVGLAWYGVRLGIPEWAQLSVGVAITTVGWVLVTLFTPPEDPQVLEDFCRKIQPAGPGWNRVRQRAVENRTPIPSPAPQDGLPVGLLRAGLGCVAVYSVMFGVGYFLYGQGVLSAVMITVGAASALLLAFTYRASSGRRLSGSDRVTQPSPSSLPGPHKKAAHANQPTNSTTPHLPAGNRPAGDLDPSGRR